MRIAIPCCPLFVQILDKPLFVPQILAWVGPGAIASWTLHFAALGLYTALGRAAAR